MTSEQIRQEEKIGKYLHLRRSRHSVKKANGGDTVQAVKEWELNFNMTNYIM